jgi:uncharacterized protein with ATP-grasp and redox domains
MKADTNFLEHMKADTNCLKCDEQEAEEQCQLVTDNNEERATATSSPSQYLLRHYSALKHTSPQ